MSEEHTEACISWPLERNIATENCASLSIARSASESTPTCLSGGAIAILTGNEVTLYGTFYSNDVAAANRVTQIRDGIAIDMVSSSVVKQSTNDEGPRPGSSMCTESERYQEQYIANSESQITTPFGGAFTINVNNILANQEEFISSKKRTDNKRSFRIGPKRSKIVPRRYSLPSRLSKLSIDELAQMAIKNSTMPIGVSNHHASESCCSGLHAVAVTPPPSYRSLTNQNISDSPPSYECVTGLNLNIGQDLLADAQKSNTRNYRSEHVERQSKILVILIVLIVLLVTVALALAEAFTV